MDRRTFTTRVALGLVAASLAVRAQQPTKIARIGFLSLGRAPTGADPYYGALQQVFREHGYLEGQNLVIERRFADGKLERLPDLAAELARAGVDAIVVAGPAPIQAAHQATKTIPIVMAAGSSDPVAEGLAVSLARPGGNITGLTYAASSERFGKQPRTSEGQNDRLPALSADLVSLAPELIIVFSAPATRATMHATATIPIVMVAVGDPVLYGIVRSYTHPGGNVTGSSYLAHESTRKTLELLKEVAPRIASVAFLVNPTNEGAEPVIREMRATAKALGVRIHLLEVKTVVDFEPAFEAIRRSRTESLLLGPEPLVRLQRQAVGRFAADQRLPLAMVGSTRYLDAGGLLTYGPSFDQYSALTARYVDRILRGASPAQLPIEQPTKFELGVNLKNAKALGLTLPQSILVRADEVIR